MFKEKTFFLQVKHEHFENPGEKNLVKLNLYIEQ